MGALSSLMPAIPAFATCTVRAPVDGMECYDQKEFGEERVYFSSQLSGHTPSLKESGQELKQAVEEHCLLTCPHGSLSLFSYAPRTPCPGLTPPTVGRTPAHQSLKKNALRLAYIQCDGGVFSAEVPSS